MTRIENIIAKLKSNHWLILILGIGAILRFYKIDFQSPWLDEMFTLNTLNTDNSWSEIKHTINLDGVHPPLYYFLLYQVFELLENSIYVMRAFSAVFGVAGLLGMYYLGKELYNKNTGLIAVILTTFNYFHIFYSQEGRMYSFLLFLLIFSFVFFTRFLKKQKIQDLGFYVLFISMAINTHFFFRIRGHKSILTLFNFIFQSKSS